MSRNLHLSNGEVWDIVYSFVNTTVREAAGLDMSCAISNKTLYDVDDKVLRNIDNPVRGLGAHIMLRIHMAIHDEMTGDDWLS